MAETPLTKVSPLAVMGGRFNIEPEKLLGVLKGTVIKKSSDGREPTNEECAAFVIVANEYGLNPFTKEIYAFPAKGGGVVPIVSIDGWCRIINNQPAFNGCEFEDEVDEEGNLVSTTCIIHVKGRDHPTRVTEYLAECYRATEPWKQMKHRMLRHKSLIQCGRYAFSLSGIFDEDEARDILGGTTEPKPTITPPQKLSAKVVATVRPVVAQELPDEPEKPEAEVYDDLPFDETVPA